MTTAARPRNDRLESRLSHAVEGDVRFDPLARTIWATDASIYEIIPAGVVLPKSVQDVIQTVCVCREHGASIVPRGAGTGLTGGAVGEGVLLDVSRYMNAIGRIDPAARTVEVQPGVVLDELNAALAPHDLHFAPDVATSSRATIGGMIANNSCGAHSIVHGRTVDHVRELTVVLGDATPVTLGPWSPTRSDATPSSPTRGDATPSSPTRGDGTDDTASSPNHTGESPVPRSRVDGTDASRRRAEDIRSGLGQIRDNNYDEIKRRFPNVLRSNGGYGLDRLGPPGTPPDPVKVLCGSEGTLGIIVGAKLNLVPRPKSTGLVLLRYENVLDALEAVPGILECEPAAVELVDRMILDAARSNPAFSSGQGLLAGDPGAVLVVEFFADGDAALREKTGKLIAALKGSDARIAAGEVLDQAEQERVWAVRTNGLGLLMSRPGDAQPYAFVEDSAVDPLRLRDYIERFGELLTREGIHETGYYAHASAGCLHVRPVLNLKKAEDIERMRRIADGVSSLAIEFGGAMTGEHGDGIIRSCWLEKMYGPQILQAFREVKRLFDPDNILNPDKIVDPRPMTENLRYGASFKSRQVKTALDFSTHGGPAGLAGMCSGVGKCRQRLVGTMCPSYMATGDETHTTRARANALRVALSNRGLLDGLDDPHLAQSMDLCLSCKACKSECPTGVDLAALKAEYLNTHNLRHGASRKTRLIADTPALLALASRFPRLSNRVIKSRVVRRYIEWLYGLDRRIEPPALAPQTFRRWFRKRRAAGFSLRERSAQAEACGSGRGRVVYFVDTWTNHFTPQVGIAAVKLLEAAGFEVLCPPHGCCGRPMISQGLLAEAKQLAETNLRALLPYAREGVPIVGTEPSCILTFVDEMPRLLRVGGTRHLAAAACTIESFLVRLLDRQPDALRFVSEPTQVRYHAHCHQKALVGSSDALRLLQHAFGSAASEINSGCCGMAGAFGLEKEHYDIARAIGEQRLFPAIRANGDAKIAISGFSCRQQIEHHTGIHAHHVVELLAQALKP